MDDFMKGACSNANIAAALSSVSFLEKSKESPAFQSELVCAMCQKKSASKLLKCSRCSSESYCSRDCQAQHWKTHKSVCVKAGTTKPSKKGNRDSENDDPKLGATKP